MVSGILVEDIIPKKGGQCSFYLKLPKIKVFKEKIGSRFDTTILIWEVYMKKYLIYHPTSKIYYNHIIILQEIYGCW